MRVGDLAVGERFRSNAYGHPEQVWVVVERWDPDPIAFCVNEAGTDEETFGFVEPCRRVTA